MLLDSSIVRIGLNIFFFQNFLKQQYAHTKSVARLVDSENWSKKIQKKTIRAHKNVVRLVDRESWSKKHFLQKENKTILWKQISAITI